MKVVKNYPAYLGAVILLVIIIWVVTNISSTVSSPADGRSISTGLLVQSTEYLTKNGPPTINEALDKIRQGNIPIFQEWLLSSFYADALNYMSMSLGLNSYEPYSLRPLYPLAVNLLAQPVKLIYGNEKYQRNQIRIHSFLFILLNTTCFMISIIIGGAILIRLGLGFWPSLCISFLSFLQLGYLKTLYAPMVDQPAVLVALLLILSVMMKRYWMAIALGGFAVLIKDGLIIYALLLFLVYFSVKKKSYWLVQL